MVFPVFIYGCKSWTIKKTERWRTDVFKLRCWRRVLRVPRTARRSNQSILKKDHSAYSLEGLMLKLQYFGHQMWRTDSLEKTLMGKDWRQEKGMTEDEKVGWHHQLDRHEFEQTPGDGAGQGSLVCCSSWGCKEYNLSTEQLTTGNTLFQSPPHGDCSHLWHFKDQRQPPWLGISRDVSKHCNQHGIRK